MACGTVVCLTSYSTVVTTILIIISCLYHNTGNYPQPTCSTGKDCTQEIQNHLDILNVDVSSNEIGQMGENGSCKCTTLQYLGFEIFEIIMLTLLGIAVIYMGFRMTTEGKTWFKKWKEARKIAKERKFEEMRAKYDATTSKRGTSKVHVETKREPKREPKRESDLVTYEKGDDYDSDADEEA